MKAVFLEGLATTEELGGYKKLAAWLRDWKEPTGNDAMSEFLREQYREDSLLLGAASRIESLEVRAAENAADPLKCGRVQFDAAAMERRESARTCWRLPPPVVVLVLGGEHDLRDNVPAGV